MTIAEPGTYPRWGDVPPVGPPTTVVEPTEGEKDIGWQPGKQAQVIDVSINTVANSQLYRVTIANLNVDYTSDPSALDTEIRDGLIAAKNALGALDTVCTAAINGTNKVRLTAFTPGVAIPITEVDTRLSLITVTPNKSDKPIRQYVNWLHWLAYLWVRFLNSVRLRWSDVGTDFFVPASWTLPTTGAGLTGTSGGVLTYQQGRRVLGSNIAKLYPDSSDTYVDLNRDGDFVFASSANLDVAGGGSVPALAASSLRCFRVSTVLGARTVSSFLGEGALGLNVPAMVDATKKWRFRDLVELGRGILGTPTVARLRIFWSSAQTYTLISEYIDGEGSPSAVVVREYVGSTGKHYRVWNGKWVSGTTWNKDTANPSTRTCLEAYFSGVQINLDTTSPFDDSTWVAAVTLDASTGQVILGNGVLSTAALANLPRINMPYSTASGSTITKMLLSSRGSEGIYGLRWFRDNATGEFWETFNADYNDGTGQWARISAGDSMRRVFSPSGGTRLEKRAAGDASPWAAGAWTVVAATDEDGNISGIGDLTALGSVIAPSATFADALTAPGVAKCAAKVRLDGGPSIIRQSGAFPITSVAVTGGGSDAVELTFDGGYPSDAIVVARIFSTGTTFDNDGLLIEEISATVLKINLINSANLTTDPTHLMFVMH